MITSAVLQSGKVRMCIVSFKSFTSAQRAVSCLKAHGIASSVVSVDPNLTKRGCSYGITFPTAYKLRALNYLRSSGIDYGDVIGV